MKEQSHKNEMSAAIRGDFQRLRDRGVAATLAPRDDEDASEPVEIVPETDELAMTVVAALPEPDPEPHAEEEVDPGDADRPGFIARLLGR